MSAGASMRIYPRNGLVFFLWLASATSCGPKGTENELLDASSNGTSSGPSYTLFEPRVDEFAQSVIRRGSLAMLPSAEQVAQSFSWEWETIDVHNLRGYADSEHVASVSAGRRDVSGRTHEKGPVWREPGGVLNMSDIKGIATLYATTELPEAPTRFVVTLQASVVGREQQYSNGWNSFRGCSRAWIELTCFYIKQDKRKRSHTYKSERSEICDTRGEWRHLEISMSTPKLDFSECRQRSGHLQARLIFSGVRQAQFRTIQIDELN